MKHQTCLARSAWVLLAVGTFAACSSDTPAALDPVRSDAATSLDGAPGPDSSVQVDAGPTLDAKSDASGDAASSTDVLNTYPDVATMTVGGPAATFVAALKIAGVPVSAASVKWSLDGPGTLSGNEGESVIYTPPATLGSVTTAKLTASHPSVPSDTSVITLKPNVATGAIYDVVGSLFNSDEGNSRVQINVSSANVPFASATVKVNGTTIPFTSTYGVQLGERLAAGAMVDLSITVPEGEIRASAAMPEAAVVTAPVAGTMLAGGDVLVTWTTPLQPSRFRGGMGLNPYDPNYNPNFNVAGAERNATLTGLPAGKSARVYVVAFNEAQNFTGPVKAGSSFAVEAFGPQSASVFSSRP
jgi:hypothetical protein